MTERFAWRGIVSRTLFSFFIVFAVFNPSGHSYWHWVTAGDGSFWSKAAVGLALLFVHGATCISILGVLRWRGVLVLTLFLVALGRSLAGQVSGPFDPVSTFTAALGGIAMLYAMGLCWSHIHHRIAGIVHVEK